MFGTKLHNWSEKAVVGVEWNILERCCFLKNISSTDIIMNKKNVLSVSLNK